MEHTRCVARHCTLSQPLSLERKSGANQSVGVIPPSTLYRGTLSWRSPNIGSPQYKGQSCINKPIYLGSSFGGCIREGVSLCKACFYV